MMEVHITNGSGKLDSIKSINTNTVTNDFCIKMNKAKDTNIICTKCYSHAMLKTFRKNCQPSFQRNSDLLSTRVLEQEELPLILDAFFRFDSHGELINVTNLINYVNIAKKNPHCSFGLWTKRKDIINRYFKDNDCPPNLILIYSNPKISNILSKPPKHFHRTFNNVLEHEEVERQNCTGQQCKNCLLCYTPNNGVDTIVEKVKRY
jgi:hypothetical protein